MLEQQAWLAYQRESFLALFRPVARFESGSTLQRRLYRKTGSWRFVMDRLALPLGLELLAVDTGRREDEVQHRGRKRDRPGD